MDTGLGASKDEALNKYKSNVEFSLSLTDEDFPNIKAKDIQELGVEGPLNRGMTRKFIMREDTVGIIRGTT